jgi:hypothetical protein
MVSGDFFEQMNAETPVKATAEAVVEGGKIKSHTTTNPELGDAPSSS